MKTMKTLRKLFIILSGVVCAAACNLDRIPVDRLTADSVFSDPQAYQTWVNECYTLFRGQSALQEDADDFIDCDPCDVVAGTRSPYTQKWDWSMLKHINYLLENISKCSDEEIAASCEAQGLFFRGLFYFEMARKFGNLPYITNTIGMQNKELMYANPIPQDYVIDAAILDMEAALDGLPAELSAAPTVVTQWVALGYIARAALYEGTLLKYQGEAKADYEEYLKTAEQACRRIMESGLFSVYRDKSWTDDNAYRNLFVMETMPSSEALLVQLFDTNTLPSGIQAAFTGLRTGATRRFINHYQLADGSSVSTRSGWRNANFFTEGEGRDPRLRQTILFPGCKEVSDNKEIRNQLQSLTGYEPIKYRRGPAGTAFNSCLPIMRYPEILLMYAEAKAELGTLTAEDVEATLNLIRARVGMPGVDMLKVNAAPDALMASYYPNVTGRNKGIILEIRRERTIELALEGLRLWDMLRWHEGAQLGNNSGAMQGIYLSSAGLVDMTGNGSPDFELYSGTPTQDLVPAYSLGEEVFLSNGSFGYVTPFAEEKLPEEPWDEDCDYLWPIPAGELAIPGSKLVQNYGYYY